MPIIHLGASGQTLHARLRLSSSSFKGVSLTDASVTGVYEATDAAILTALNAAGYSGGDADLTYSVRSGATSDSSNATIVGGGTLGWTGSVERPVMATVDSDSAVGSGADEVTITITTNTGPVDDAQVWITTDADGDSVVAGTLRTNSQGEATFLLDDGNTYYLWMQKSGVNSIEGEQFVAEAD